MAWVNSVRVRAAMVAAVLVGVVATAGAWLLLDRVEQELLGGIRSDADAAAEEAAAAVRRGTPHAAGPVPGALVEIFTEDGKPLTPTFGIISDQTTQPGSVETSTPPLLHAPPLDTAPSYETTVGGTAYTVSTRRVGGPMGSIIVMAALPLEEVERSVAAIRDKLAFGVPILGVLASLMGWFLAGRALRPIERMRREVEAVSAMTIDRRVRPPRTRDEVGRLATTMNQMLDRLQQAAERQRRFVSDASHELRSPLATLRADVELGLAHPESADWSAIAEGVLRDSQQLDALIDELLELARLEEQVPALLRVDLADVLREESCRPRDIPVTVCADESAMVFAEEKALISLVRNLLDNAARHAKSRVEARIRARNDEWLLDVDDDGPGVPEDLREQVFARFTRTDESRARTSGGVGLGLAIVDRVARSLGGDVSVGRSRLGGARFTVRLPRPRQEATAAAPARPPVEGRDGTRRPQRRGRRT